MLYSDVTAGYAIAHPNYHSSAYQAVFITLNTRCAIEALSLLTSGRNKQHCFALVRRHGGKGWSKAQAEPSYTEEPPEENGAQTGTGQRETSWP